MTTTKYAIDLHDGDRIIDKKTERVVFIDWIHVPDTVIPSNTLRVYGYFEDDGSDWTRDLDLDSKVRVLDTTP
jgi:hypothetical protein